MRNPGHWTNIGTLFGPYRLCGRFAVIMNTHVPTNSSSALELQIHANEDMNFAGQGDGQLACRPALSNAPAVTAPSYAEVAQLNAVITHGQQRQTRRVPTLQFMNRDHSSSCNSAPSTSAFTDRDVRPLSIRSTQHTTIQMSSVITRPTMQTTPRLSSEIISPDQQSSTTSRDRSLGIHSRGSCDSRTGRKALNTPASSRGFHIGYKYDLPRTEAFSQGNLSNNPFLKLRRILTTPAT